MPNHTVMPRIREWLQANGPAPVAAIAKGADVSRPSVYTFLDSAYDAGELETTSTGEGHLYRLRPGGRFEAELAAASAGAPLDEALAGLHRVAAAAGIFEETWHAHSVGEVCDIIAAWCRARRRERPALDTSGERVAEYRAMDAINAGRAVELDPHMPGLVRPLRPGTGRRPLGVALHSAACNEQVSVRRSDDPELVDRPGSFTIPPARERSRWDDPDVMAADLRQAIRDIEAGSVSPRAALIARLITMSATRPGEVLPLAEVIPVIVEAAAEQIASGGPMWRLRCSHDIAQAGGLTNLSVESVGVWLAGRWELLDNGSLIAGEARDGTLRRRAARRPRPGRLRGRVAHGLGDRRRRVDPGRLMAAALFLGAVLAVVLAVRAAPQPEPEPREPWEADPPPPDRSAEALIAVACAIAAAGMLLALLSLALHLGGPPPAPVRWRLAAGEAGAQPGGDPLPGEPERFPAGPLKDRRGHDGRVVGPRGQPGAPLADQAADDLAAGLTLPHPRQLVAGQPGGQDPQRHLRRDRRAEAEEPGPLPHPLARRGQGVGLAAAGAPLALAAGDGLDARGLAGQPDHGPGERPRPVAGEPGEQVGGPAGAVHIHVELLGEDRPQAGELRDRRRQGREGGLAVGGGAGLAQV